MRFRKVIKIWEKILYYPVFIGHLFILQTKISTRQKLEKLVEKCRKDLLTIRHMKIKNSVRHSMGVSHKFSIRNIFYDKMDFWLLFSCGELKFMSDLFLLFYLLSFKSSFRCWDIQILEWKNFKFHGIIKYLNPF